MPLRSVMVQLLPSGSHLPLLGQFGNVRPGVAVNADEILQGRPFIELATAALQPGKVGIPAQGRDGDPEPLQLRRLADGAVVCAQATVATSARCTHDPHTEPRIPPSSA